MVEAWTSRQKKLGIFRQPPENRDAIAAVLTRVLPDRGTVLEIGSGSGEHAHHFSELFPHLTWQPSDPDQLNLDSILAWVDAAGRPNLRPPLSINASDVILPLDSADAVVCVNVIHISPWDATEGLMRNAALGVAAGRAAVPIRSLPDCRLPHRAIERIIRPITTRAERNLGGARPRRRRLGSR